MNDNFSEICAKNAALELENDKLREDHENRYQKWVNKFNTQSQTLYHAELHAAFLKEVLKFYANEKYYEEEQPSGIDEDRWGADIDADSGGRARIALSQAPDTSGAVDVLKAAMAIKGFAKAVEGHENFGKYPGAQIYSYNDVALTFDQLKALTDAIEALSPEFKQMIEGG